LSLIGVAYLGVPAEGKVPMIETDLSTVTAAADEV
jgi:hypothetical protein